MRSIREWHRHRKRRPKTVRCLRCKAKITLKPKGPVPDYCSHSCRQIAYEKRKNERPRLRAILAQDLLTYKMQSAIRREVLATLRDLMPDLPLPAQPPARPTKPKPKLRVVHDAENYKKSD